MSFAPGSGKATMPQPEKPVVRKLAAAKRAGGGVRTPPAAPSHDPAPRPRGPLTVGPSPEELARDLRAHLEHLGLDSAPSVTDRLLAYLRLLQKWNATYNLTALRASETILTHHLADCLAAVPALRRHLDQHPGHAPVPVLDVGSGGGLPGVVLALLLPDLAVTCVDTVGKKTAFIQQAALELGLRNLRAEHARVENLSGQYRVITSRAFASLPDFTALTSQLLAPGGCWMAMKGKLPQEELAGLPPTVQVDQIEPLQVPGLDADRCLVWMTPQAK